VDNHRREGGGRSSTGRPKMHFLHFEDTPPVHKWPDRLRINVRNAKYFVRFERFRAIRSGRPWTRGGVFKKNDVIQGEVQKVTFYSKKLDFLDGWPLFQLETFITPLLQLETFKSKYLRLSRHNRRLYIQNNRSQTTSPMIRTQPSRL